MRWPPNILVCGDSGCGKDTFALYFCDGVDFEYAGSMSMVIAPRIANILGILADEALEIRHENRALWFNEGNAMRAENPTALLEAGFAKGNVLTGARNLEEINLGDKMGIVDWFIYIVRSGNAADQTMEYDENYLPEAKKIVVANDGTLEDLKATAIMIREKIAMAIGAAH